MAPATIAGATRNRTAAGRRGGWDRDAIIEAIQEWAARFGEPPRAADWNPSAAKWSGQQWRVERYRAGRADGSPWPALNSAKKPFGGSLNAAITAAGFAPARPGPRRRASVDPEQADRAHISPEGHAMLRAALAQAREAEQRVAVLEARLARRGGGPERGRDPDDAALAAAERRVAAAEARATAAIADARARVDVARADAAEARRSARRLAGDLERAEATVAALRAERRTAARGGSGGDAARALGGAERAALRTGGPGGPAALAASLKALARARSDGGGGPTALEAALLEVASAAITWRERI